ncbi:MAG: tetratricopeptide repeat protein [Planctomycetia bacterium]
MPATAEPALDPLDIAIEHHHAGRFQEAEQLYRAILQRNPQERDALHLLGVIAHQAGRQADAVSLIQQAILLDAAQAKFHNSLGSVYQSVGHTVAAVACFHQGVMLDREYPEGHNNLGMALMDLQRPAEAAAALERAVQLKPDYANAHNNLGLAQKALGRFAEATVSFRRAAQLRDGFWEPLFQLGNVLRDQGRIAEAIEQFERVLKFEPHAFTSHCNLLCNLQYRDGITLEELAAAHAGFNRTFGEPFRHFMSPHHNDRDPDRPLRIGFVSADFHRHPVGFFTVRMFERLDRRQVEAICYSNNATSDEITSRIKASVAAWRDSRNWNDDQLTQAIRDDRIDILFDLSGHTRDTRLPVFARKPAPIQVTWAGYVGTTGVTAIDYVLADRHQVPEEAEPWYVERILRMPNGYVSYDPPSVAPPVSPLPALATGRVTFGSFNNQAKVGPGAVATWARVLHRVPGSRLVLKYYAMSNPAVTGRLREMFAGHGIEPDRLVFLGSTSHMEQLEQYREIDIGLDTFPYSGGLTTLEALWMGVPVVTCPGETFASRHSLSHLSNVGLTTTIARDLDEYVDVAASLAADLPALSALRAGLREKVATSPLCDGERFARDFERIMRGVWNDWLYRTAEFGEGRGPEPSPEPDEADRIEAGALA